MDVSETCKSKADSSVVFTLFASRVEIFHVPDFSGFDDDGKKACRGFIIVFISGITVAMIYVGMMQVQRPPLR